MALGPLAPWIDRGFRDNVGNVLSGGFVEVYLAGTSTPTDTYTESDLVTPNANPVELDAAGRATMYLDPSVTYKFVVTDSGGSTLYTLDDVPGIIPVQNPITVTEDGIGSTSTDGIVLINNTLAANGAQQWSPRIRWTGAGWNATAAASRVVDALAEMVPLQQVSGDPIAALTFSTQVNGGGYTPRLAIRSDGAAVLGSAGRIAWSSSGLTSLDTAIRRTAAAKLAFDDGAAGVGFILSFATANTAILRNLADSDYANLFARTILATSAGDIPITSSNPTLADNVIGGGVFFGRQQATDEGCVWFFRPQATDANSTAELYWYGGTLSATFTKGGTLQLQGSLQFNTTTESIVWSSQSRITGVGNGVIKLTNNAATAGVGLRFSTDGTLEIRDRTNASYANLRGDDIHGLSFTVNGTAGADFNGAVTNITVEKGIVTAAS